MTKEFKIEKEWFDEETGQFYYPGTYSLGEDAVQRYKAGPKLKKQDGSKSAAKMTKAELIAEVERLKSSNGKPALNETLNAAEIARDQAQDRVKALEGDVETLKADAAGFLAVFNRVNDGDDVADLAAATALLEELAEAAAGDPAAKTAGKDDPKAPPAGDAKTGDAKTGGSKTGGKPA